MGALQPGLPNPAMIPAGWYLLIIDLKDCFFTIALHADDKQPASLEPPLSPHCRARESHAIFHQNARGLAQSYNIAIEEARAIVKACAICSHHNLGLG
ncbi:Endogenous retrovirus group K member 18 Pol protein, partial [Eudyptula minor novaehollandiae]